MSRPARLLAVVPVAALAAGLLGPSAAVATTTATTAPRPVHALRGASGPDTVTRLIVRTAPGTTVGPSLRGAVASAADVAAAGTVRRLAGGATLVALSAPLSTQQAWAAARALEARPDVVSAEPDIRLFPADASPVTPNDPLFPDQWDLWDTTRTGGGFSSRVPGAWTRTTGAGQVVAVVDTGITSHPDLDTNVVAGYDFVSSDARVVDPSAPEGTTYLLANDGDGRDPDPSDPGDWITAAESTGLAAGGFFTGCEQTVSSWHGTHVAGTVAAVKGNGNGIAGIAPSVQLQPVRALGKCGGSLSDVADAIRWAAGGTVPGVPANPTPASVVNLSLGGSGACSAYMQSAVSDAVSRGATVVVAAGNSGQSITPTSPSSETTGSTPANCTGVVTVTATTRAGTRASYANFGTVAGTVALAAPGGDSAYPVVSAINLGTTTPGAAGYKGYQGTSMAAPHVAAAVALVQSTLTTPLTPAQVRTRLSATAQPFPAGSGCTTVACGAGILDVAAAVPGVPDAPVITLAPGDGALTVYPGSGGDGGAPITGWRVSAAVQGEPLTEVVTLPAATASAALTEIGGVPLVNGTTYEVSVIAVNDIGESTPGTATGTPAAVNPPLPITAAYTTTPGVERFTVAWSPAAVPAGSPAVTGYAVRYRKVGSATWLTTTAAAGETSKVLSTWPTAMAAGTWEVQVAGMNPVGTAPYLGSVVGRATVTALAQSARLSTGSVLYPFRDGYLDGVTVQVSSNLAAAGTVRILNSAGGVVRQWSLPSGTSSSVVWTGTTAAGTRVPAGTYRAQVLLVGRTSAQVQVASLPISVRLSQVTTPSVSLSSATVYPVKDGYKDTVRISARANIPATFTYRIVKNGRVLWSKAFTRRTAAAWSWGGVSGSGARLAEGSYTLRVTARGGEGTAVTRSRTIAVSAKRAVAESFALSPSPAAVARYGGGNPKDPYVVDDYAYFPADSVITFTRTLPASVKPHSGIRITACGRRIGDLRPTPVLGYFAGAASNPTFYPVARELVAGSGCATTSSGPPLAATDGGTLRWYIANLRLTGSTWRLDSLRITGTRYVLR